MLSSAMFLVIPLWTQVSPAASPPVVAPQPRSAASVILTLRLPDGRRQFKPGEVIPFELEFSSETPKRFSVDGATYDRSGRLTIDDFTIDRIDEVTDPMLDYFASSGGFVGGGIRGMGVLGEKPFTIKLELNDWFRFDTPGVFTLAVRSRRVSDESVTPPATVPVESNTVSFEILPRDPAWEASELETARRIVDADQPPAGARRGCRMMRFLGTDAAVAEIVRRYGAGAGQGCDFDYMAGLFSAANREKVVQAMEDGLRAGDQPVTTGYLRTLSVLSVYLRHPDFRPAQTRAAKGRLAAGGELTRHSDLIDAALSAYRDLLTAALPGKTDRARAITLAEVPALAPQRQPPPGSLASQDQLAARFLDLPAGHQTTLLEDQWQTVSGPAMLPVLRRLVGAPAADASPVFDLALRRLTQLAPAEARPLILREIRNPRPGATAKTLGSLPDDELPELDDVLAANFEANNSEINAALVKRYATRKIAPRILARAGDAIGRMACAQQGSILAYFLRVDQATGATLLDRAMTSRATGCWRSLHGIAGMRLPEALETRAIADLGDPDPEVVTAAIQMLGRHGSAAALAPLRAAFQRWHAAWAGRGADLAFSRAVERPHAKQAMVEDAFRQAIGTGHGWLMRAGDLRELHSLCVTDNCRAQTTQMMREDDTSIRLTIVNEPDQSHIELAQYIFSSIGELEKRLAQYPRGTAFTLLRNANVTREVTAAIARLVAFAASLGLSIKEP